MGRSHLDPVLDPQTWRIGIHDEGGQAFGARRLARANEDDVMVGNAAVRDPGFFAVDQHMAVAIGHRTAGKRRHIRSRFLFGKRECSNALSRRDGRQITLPLCRRSKQADGTGA
jgi:hypothetical protein